MEGTAKIPTRGTGLTIVELQILDAACREDDVPETLIAAHVTCLDQGSR